MNVKWSDFFTKQKQIRLKKSALKGAGFLFYINKREKERNEITWQKAKGSIKVGL